jgi:hypothetical protein
LFDVEQVQMDELFALRSVVKDGEVSEQQAIQRLSCSPPWVWVAMDPVCKLILAVDTAASTAEKRLCAGQTGRLAREDGPADLQRRGKAAEREDDCRHCPCARHQY